MVKGRWRRKNHLMIWVEILVFVHTHAPYCSNGHSVLKNFINFIINVSSFTAMVQLQF